MNANRVRRDAAQRLHGNVWMVLALAAVMSAGLTGNASARKREDSGRGGRVTPGGYGRVIRLDRAAPVQLAGKRVFDLRTWRLQLPLARAAR